MKLQFGELRISPRVVDRLHELDFTVPELEDAINEHKSELDGEPSVYCGTYHKYNEGSLRGLWVSLSSFDDYDDFINFCNAIHADESDPELMFQDFENFPRCWYSESCFGRETFDKIKQYEELCDEYSKEAVDAFISWKDEDSLDSFKDCYVREAKDEEDYAWDHVHEIYDLSRMQGLENYIDYKKFAEDLFEEDYYFDNGFVFRSS